MTRRKQEPKNTILMNTSTKTRRLKEYEKWLAVDYIKQVEKMFIESPEDIDIIAKLVSLSENSSVRKNGIVILKKTANKEYGVKLILSEFVKSVKTGIKDVQINCIEALVKVDITQAMSVFVKALGDESADERRGAAEALGTVAKRGVDITQAIPALVKLLINMDDQRWVALALKNMIKNDHNSRTSITKAVMDFTNSHEFMIEAEKNSDRFIETINTIDQLTRKIDELEKQAA